MGKFISKSFHGCDVNFIKCKQCKENTCENCWKELIDMNGFYFIKCSKCNCTTWFNISDIFGKTKDFEAIIVDKLTYENDLNGFV